MVCLTAEGGVEASELGSMLPSRRIFVQQKHSGDFPQKNSRNSCSSWFFQSAPPTVLATVLLL